MIGLTDYDSSVTMFNDFFCVTTHVEIISLLLAILYLGELSISISNKHWERNWSNNQEF